MQIHLNNLDSDKIANIIWKEICSYMNIRIPNTRVSSCKRKKATVVQSPKNFELVKI